MNCLSCEYNYFRFTGRLLTRQNWSPKSAWSKWCRGWSPHLDQAVCAWLFCRVSIMVRSRHNNAHGLGWSWGDSNVWPLKFSGVCLVESVFWPCKTGLSKTRPFFNWQNVGSDPLLLTLMLALFLALRLALLTAFSSLQTTTIEYGTAWNRTLALKPYFTKRGAIVTTDCK